MAAAGALGLDQQHAQKWVQDLRARGEEPNPHHEQAILPLYEYEDNNNPRPDLAALRARERIRRWEGRAADQGGWALRDEDRFTNQRWPIQVLVIPSAASTVLAIHGLTETSRTVVYRLFAAVRDAVDGLGRFVRLQHPAHRAVVADNAQHTLDDLVHLRGVVQPQAPDVRVLGDLPASLLAATCNSDVVHAVRRWLCHHGYDDHRFLADQLAMRPQQWHAVDTGDVY